MGTLVIDYGTTFEKIEVAQLTITAQAIIANGDEIVAEPALEFGRLVWKTGPGMMTEGKEIAYLSFEQ